MKFSVLPRCCDSAQLYVNNRSEVSSSIKKVLGETGRVTHCHLIFCEGSYFSSAGPRWRVRTLEKTAIHPKSPSPTPPHPTPIKNVPSLSETSGKAGLWKVHTVHSEFRQASTQWTVTNTVTAEFTNCPCVSSIEENVLQPNPEWTHIHSLQNHSSDLFLYIHQVPEWLQREVQH